MTGLRRVLFGLRGGLVLPALMVLAACTNLFPQSQVSVTQTGENNAPAVAVPAGSHQVRLVFDPPLWRRGWLLAGVSAAIVVALAALGVLRGRRRPASPRAATTP